MAIIAMREAQPRECVLPLEDLTCRIAGCPAPRKLLDGVDQDRDHAKRAAGVRPVGGTHTAKEVAMSTGRPLSPSYLDCTGRDDILSGGVRLIPIDTPKGTFRVTIRITTSTGRKLTGRRRYRTCRPK